MVKYGIPYHIISYARKIGTINSYINRGEIVIRDDEALALIASRYVPKKTIAFPKFKRYKKLIFSYNIG